MNECNVVRDLIPLYADDLLSSDSVEFIQRHIRGCPECQKIWQRYEQALPEIQVQNPTAEKRIIKKALRRDRLKTMAKTTVTLLLVLSIVTCFALQTMYSYGLLYSIEASYAAPDGSCTLELVDRDSFSARSDGYLIRFKFDRGIGGINRYWTDWDTIDAHWAPNSIHLLLMLTNMEGQPEIRIVDTVKQETQGGTWDIPGMTEDLIPILTGLCKAHADFPTGWNTIRFTFDSWLEDSETVTFRYETELGQSGLLTYHYPSGTLMDAQ